MYLPAGTVMAYAGAMSTNTLNTLKSNGFLYCNGASYSSQTYPALYSAIGNTYGGNSTNFCVPDYRGVFLRGLDAGKGYDSGRGLGGFQDDEFRQHSHFVGFKHHRSFRGENANDHPIKNCSGSHFYTGGAGGKETRPKNISVNYIIFAGLSV